jgi:hypothetical protein
MGHCNTSLSQNWTLIQQSINDNIIIRNAKVEYATSIMASLVGRRLKDTVNRCFEVISSPPQHGLSGIYNDGPGNIFHISPFRIVVVVSNLKGCHRLTKEERQTGEILVSTQPHSLSLFSLFRSVLIEIFHVSKPGLVMFLVTVESDEEILVLDLQCDGKNIM